MLKIKAVLDQPKIQQNARRTSRRYHQSLTSSDIRSKSMEYISAIIPVENVI